MPVMERRIEQDQIETLIMTRQTIAEIKLAGALRAIPRLEEAGKAIETIWTEVRKTVDEKIESVLDSGGT